MGIVQHPIRNGRRPCVLFETIGGIDMQLTRLGAVLNLDIAENATIATTYDRKIRTYANELSKFREREEDIVSLLNEGDRPITREVIRECGPETTFAPRNADF